MSRKKSLRGSQLLLQVDFTKSLTAAAAFRISEDKSSAKNLKQHVNSLFRVHETASRKQRESNTGSGYEATHVALISTNSRA